MTRQEKAVIYFLAFMLALGLGVKFYKANFPGAGLKVEKVGLVAEKIDIQRIIKQRQAVRVNIASKDDFTRLPGIGPALADRIVKYREQNGAFSAPEDLKKVKGIGEKKYDAIREFLAAE